MGFWTGLIIIVLTLEAARIALSAAVLIHVLKSARFDGATTSQQMLTRPQSGERELLRRQTIDAVRLAMDEFSQQRPGAGTRQAAESLARYTRNLTSEAAQ